MSKHSPLPETQFHRYSVAMTGEIDRQLRGHLIRNDGQEDLCMAVYQPSSGAIRQTALISQVVLPQNGETQVHGNVSFSGDYVLRTAKLAAEHGGGVVLLHSHPMGRDWQAMSGPDADAEASYANLVREMTGLPLVGMTFAGRTMTWSARFWNRGTGNNVSWRDCESVRVISDCLRISWNPAIRPPPTSTNLNQRTASSWGAQTHADIARLRVLVVGLGTVGLDVASRLAATGIQSIGCMDFDSLKAVNLDRMIGATPLDVKLHRSKIEVATQILLQNTTAHNFCPIPLEGSICEEDFFKRALDFDLIFSCVDQHPWPRSVLNVIAYADLIPVIDGGIHIDAFPEGTGMRNATWRSHVLRPGRPCMACNGQLDLGQVYADKEGLLDEESYISGLPATQRPRNENVATLSVGAASALLSQFISYLAAPGGLGDPGPLRYTLSCHWLEHIQVTTRQNCIIESNTGVGDSRHVLLDEHEAARKEASKRQALISRSRIKLARAIDSTLISIRNYLAKSLP